MLRSLIVTPSTPTVSRCLHSPSPPSSPTVPASIIEPHQFSTPADGGEVTRRRGIETTDRDDGTRRGTEATRLSSGRKRDVSMAEGGRPELFAQSSRSDRSWLRRRLRRASATVLRRQQVAGNRRRRPKSPKAAQCPAARSREHRPATTRSQSLPRVTRDAPRHHLSARAVPSACSCPADRPSSSRRARLAREETRAAVLARPGDWHCTTRVFPDAHEPSPPRRRSLAAHDPHEPEIPAPPLSAPAPMHPVQRQT
ncbi:zinc finger (Ran-binding) family protein [Striga asiatica]|uniref:Zinc finger (Ran-binding) family protein n=1 Tax=Striga asiatica TaxID=4170 RepID=A0A5A7QKF0_STRAF|nr:zinc finger (Ran-binding) family protein [Striga asiatica]